MRNFTPAGRKYGALSCYETNGFFTKALAALFFLTFSILYTAQSQNPQSHRASPSCNLSGTLKARVVAPGGSSVSSPVIIQAEVGGSDATSNLAYSIGDNLSGASIKSYGPVNYNPASGVTTQQIIVDPGTIPGAQGLKLKLSVTNADGGKCKCSKSVSLTN